LWVPWNAVENGDIWPRVLRKPKPKRDIWPRVILKPRPKRERIF